MNMNLIFDYLQETSGLTENSLAHENKDLGPLDSLSPHGPKYDGQDEAQDQPTAEQDIANNISSDNDWISSSMVDLSELSAIEQTTVETRPDPAKAGKAKRKAIPTPKHQLDPDDPKYDEKERKSILQARKCKRQRDQKVSNYNDVIKENELLAMEASVWMDCYEGENKRVKELESENKQLRQHISDLTFNNFQSQ